MTINDLVDNWSDILPKRKIAALEQLLNFFKYEEATDAKTEDLMLLEIFELASEWEGEDFFGTEGLQV